MKSQKQISIPLGNGDCWTFKNPSQLVNRIKHRIIDRYGMGIAFNPADTAFMASAFGSHDRWPKDDALRMVFNRPNDNGDKEQQFNFTSGHIDCFSLGKQASSLFAAAPDMPDEPIEEPVTSFPWKRSDGKREVLLTLSPNVHQELSFQAHQHRRSLSAYLSAIIEGKVDMKRVEEERARLEDEHIITGVIIRKRVKKGIVTELMVYTPYNEIFNARRKIFGGAWSKSEGCWLFKGLHLEGLRALLIDVFVPRKESAHNEEGT